MFLMKLSMTMSFWKQLKNGCIQTDASIFIFCLLSNHYALSTYPDLKHAVQTLIFLAAPLMFTLTDLTFDFHILFDLLCEWLTLFPKCTPLLQISHFAILPLHLLKLHLDIIRPSTNDILSDKFLLCKHFLNFILYFLQKDDIIAP